MNKTEAIIVHSVPKHEEMEHIHSTQCPCHPIVFIGRCGEIIIRHRNFFFEFSFKREFEQIGIN